MAVVFFSGVCACLCDHDGGNGDGVTISLHQEKLTLI